MTKNINLGLEGSFKVDLFRDKKFVSSTDYFSNFITPTGLLMPLTYPFADCFRYLSIGRSSIAHSGSTGLAMLGTTGLYDPISSYVTSAGTQNGQYINWRGYASGETNSNCGTTLSETGPRFYRAWYVPTGADDVTINEDGGGLMISEFMVSPSSGENLIGRGAFSRVVRDIFIPNGYRAIISYQLKINLQNTGITYFSGGAFQTGNAETSNDLELIREWSNLSGYYRQVYHGLRCVDSLGFTYIPKLGDGMEPSSTNTRKMVWYLSPENSQFDVNTTGGSNQTSVAKSYQSDGLMSTIKSLTFSDVVANPSYESLDEEALTVLYNTSNPVTLDTVPTETTLSNIRLGSINSPLLLPQTDNYKNIDDNNTDFTYQTKQVGLENRTISYATPGKNGWSDFHSDFGKKAIFSSNTTKVPLVTGGQNAITGRKKTVTRKSIFSPVSSLGTNCRLGSLTYAYESQLSSEGNSLYYPLVDTLFFDSSGKSLMSHYRFISGIYLTERGTGILESYIYLSGQIGNNIFRFVPRPTFQGPTVTPNHHLTYAQIPSNEDGSPIEYYSGFMATGSFNSNNQGQTGGLTVTGVYYSGGYGSVYGVIVNNDFYSRNYDLGLSSRTLNNLSEPSTTGKLYWPVVSSENEIKLYVTGVKFWTPELGGNVITDNSGWYNSDRQIIKDINFSILTTGLSPIIATNYVKNVTGNFTSGSNSLSSGYYITNRRYDNNVIRMEDLVMTSNFNLTGYIIPNDRHTGSIKLKGGIWDDGGQIPTDNLFFTPETSGAIFSGRTVRKITRLFAGVNDRGYTNGTGGTPIKNNAETLVFFSGFSGTSPLYVTFISGSGITSAMGFSFLTGTVSITNFCSPTGYPYHGENSGSYGFKLLPNYTNASYYSEATNSPVIGGSLPATSLDNGIELYLSISYSSACGNAVNGSTCIEPI